MTQSKDYISQVEDRLEQIEGKIDEVQSRVENAELEKRLTYNRMTSELYGLVKDVRMKALDLETTTENNWEEMKERTEESLAELQRSVREKLEKMTF